MKHIPTGQKIDENAGCERGSVHSD